MALKGVLVDLSGTLHIEDQMIPGASKALDILRKSGRGIKFLTNTTKESVNVLHNRLLKCGFTIEKSEIFSSLSAARRLIESKNLRPMFLLEDVAMEDLEGIDTSDPNAVVVGLAPSKFDYDHMNEAFRLLLLNDAELIAIHKGKYYRAGDGLSLGPGPFISALEYASGKQSTIVGKPTTMFFNLGLSALGDLEPNEVVMIGDDVNDDVMGAIGAGMRGILVQTGKYREGDEYIIPEEKRNCVASFAQAVDFIENGNVL